MLFAVTIVSVGVILALPSAATATTLPAKITENTTLTAAGNPYTGSPTIESGVTLKVEPGVKFLINSLIVKGTLDVDGTAEEPVVFTGALEKTKGEWSGIKLESGSGASVIDHAELRYGGGFGGTIQIVGGSSPTITNSTIFQSYGRGIDVAEGGSPEIASNNILASAEYGIIYQATGTKTGAVNIHDNFIEGGLNGIYVGITSTWRTDPLETLNPSYFGNSDRGEI